MKELRWPRRLIDAEREKQKCMREICRVSKKYTVRARDLLCERKICRACEMYIVHAKSILCAREKVEKCVREKIYCARAQNQSRYLIPALAAPYHVIRSKI